MTDRNNKNAASGPLTGMRILLIEDNGLTAFLIETALMEHGAEVVETCTTAAEAMRRLDLDIVDFVLIDLKLGDHFANDVISELSARRKKFIVITGMLAFPDIIPSEAVAVLRKPIDAGQLVDLLVGAA